MSSGQDLLERLLGYLASQDPAQVQKAVETLTSLEDQEARDVLAALAHYPEEAHTLADYAPALEARLRPLVTSADPVVRAWAADILSHSAVGLAQAVEPSPPPDWVKLGVRLAQVLPTQGETGGPVPVPAPEGWRLPSGVQEALDEAKGLLKSSPGVEEGVLSPRLARALQEIVDHRLGLQEAAREGEEARLALLSYLVHEAPQPLLELPPTRPEIRSFCSRPTFFHWVEEGMASAEPEKRQRYLALAGWGTGLYPLLLKALEDPYPPVRSLATRLLAASLAASRQD